MDICVHLAVVFDTIDYIDKGLISVKKDCVRISISKSEQSGRNK
ncbi:hypothetical protein ZOD2009_20093 [Haladaptatus paucihalophilus DX253]|uniref:Uncharacterized protein n=1 Tax=Haladaptatus paucihalophilus DX253 TaxID=797209 RepID=E7QYX8_HALPU|nr:hypothetical protein ZOD2009_20093 [Haladaptatus paucihalophilus DX253]